VKRKNAKTLNPKVWECKGGEKIMAAGTRRRGKPRTDEERRTRHKRIHGTDELPPRGTGLKRKKR